MVGSDEVIIITNLEWANRFAHVSAVKETCAANGKIASVEPGMGELGPDRRGPARAIARAKDGDGGAGGQDARLRVTTPAGTDFTVSIEGRPALEVTPIKQRGQMMGPVPLWAEVAFAAVEDVTARHAPSSTASCSGIGLAGQVNEPIRWTLEGGRCVAIEGGDEAERLRKVIDGVENADVIGEFAFGVSDKAPYGTPSEKGRVGTVHLALGDNHNAYPGGQNVCTLHLDGVFLDATMQIVDDGRLHPARRPVGAVSEVSVVALEAVEPIPLPGSSWSRMLVTGGHGRRQPQLAGRLGLHARHRPHPGRATRPRRWPTWSRAAASCAWTTAPCPSGPATRCTSRAGCGTRWPTPATMTSSWSSASPTPSTRRRSGGDAPGAAVIGSAQLLKEHLASACRILAHEGYNDLTLGHLSARANGGDAILIKRKGVALDEVEPDDIVEVGLDGTARGASPADIHLETILHTEVYRARPDVGAVVHGHPPFATALASTEAPLELLTHDAVLFADGLARYDDSADLITMRRAGSRGGPRAGRPAGRAAAKPRRAGGGQGSPLGRADRGHPGARGAHAVDRRHPRAGPAHRARGRPAAGPGQVPGPVRRGVLGVLAAAGAPGGRVSELAFRLNGREVRAEAAANALLLDVLREGFDLTGAKRSCDVQVCGTCTVLLDGAPVSSCCTLAWEASGREVLTIEGLAERDEFGPIEDAFTRHIGTQCGYCTPGMVLTVKALLDAGELPADEGGVRAALSGNVCRCTGYRGILDAVLELARR